MDSLEYEDLYGYFSDSDNDDAEYIGGGGSSDIKPSEVLAAAAGGDRVKNRGGYIRDGDAFNRSISSGALPETISSCSIVAASGERDICSGRVGKLVMAEMVGADESEDDKEVLERAKAETGCDHKKCVINSKKFIDIAGSTISKTLAKASFKPSGPTDTTWLNNFNIEDIFNQFKVAFPHFEHAGYSMSDFLSAGPSRGDRLCRANLPELYKAGKRTFACIVNTTKYSTSGQHWMAIFVDMRGDDTWSVEFFNSSGNPPNGDYVPWLQKTKEELEKIHPTEVQIVCKIAHQKSRSECGVYSLFYIWARLNKVPYTAFMDNEIGDGIMLEFRQHMFESKDNKSIFKPGEKFTFGKFGTHVKVGWESGIPDSKRVAGGAEVQAITLYYDHQESSDMSVDTKDYNAAVVDFLNLLDTKEQDLVICGPSVSLLADYMLGSPPTTVVMSPQSVAHFKRFPNAKTEDEFKLIL